MHVSSMAQVERSPFHEETLTDVEWGHLSLSERGFLLGVLHYAWWKDGVPMVGSTGQTFRGAVDRALQEWGHPR